jgi:hypothetical protein
MVEYRSKRGRCPETWRDIGTLLSASRVLMDSSGAPLDPTGIAYVLVREKCDVTVDDKSEVPYK